MLRVMIDADVLSAGAASPSERSASTVVLRLSDLTVIDGVASGQVVAEAETNLREKIPAALPAFEELTTACLRVVADPTPSEVRALGGLAHPKDLPILAAAVREQCPELVTFNGRDYRPGHPDVEVVSPGVLVQRIRRRVTQGG